MKALGWTSVTQQDSDHVQISQWMSEADGEHWYCLLWMIADEAATDSYLAHLQLLT
jgi:hypothetical protein